MKSLVGKLIFVTLLPGILSMGGFLSVVPDNARQNFSLNFYRNVNDNRDADFVISPAGVQKFLVVLYDGSEEKMRHEILYDLCVKIVETYSLRDMMIALSQQVLREEPHRVFFQNDFIEGKETFKIKNYIIGASIFGKSFKNVAQHYFDVRTINRLEDVDQYELVRQEFQEIIDENANLQIISSIELEANLKGNIVLKEGKLIGTDEFRYGTHENMQIVELPLQTNEELTLEIFLPNSKDELQNFIDQLGRSMKHMNEYDEKLELKTVRIMLPEFTFHNITNLSKYFKNHGTAMKRMFTENIGLGYISDEIKNGTKIDSFWQITKVHIKPSIDSHGSSDKMAKEAIEKHDETKDNKVEIFDATEKSFIYFIKSKEILYFAGVHYAFN